MKIADAHCDTLSGLLDNNEKFTSNSLQIDKSKLLDGGFESYLQFYAVFVHPSLDYEDGWQKTEAMIDLYNRIVDEGHIKAVKGLSDLKETGLMGLLSIEGMYFTGKNKRIVETLYDKGVRCMSLTWNPDNQYAGGITGEKSGGLTKEGRRVVADAFEKGILLDVSHISDKGFYEIAEIADSFNKPFVATHSNARNICHHLRNLDNDMLEVIAKTDGFTGINMYSCFLSDNCEADIEDVVAHIDYICGIVGAEHVSLGSDFDGIDRDKSAIEGPWEMPDIIDRLLSMNYNEDDVRKIAYGNIERVLSRILK